MVYYKKSSGLLLTPLEARLSKTTNIKAPLSRVLFSGMQEKKRQEKTPSIPELKSSVAEILVANGRSFQPFIRTFSYTGENVSKSGLGTLVGVFEIDEMSEDSAYIVNFLASVAKKEYFNNPRRGAIESFEAALHKINLALAELVKHGNVAWLGKFHGAIGVLEKNNLHFSVTGKANIILFRNNALSDISVGLSSEESRLHPIKTFVEVSSGRLMLDDRIIITSPELLALFSLDDLTKNARRMDHDRFTQFLKTALVNELDMTAALIIDIHEEVVVPRPKPSKKAAAEATEHVHNVFSQSAFSEKKGKAETSPEDVLKEEVTTEKEREEYVDSKTGHIYVQGAEPGAVRQNPQLERFLLGFQDAASSFFAAQGRWFRKGKKQAILSFHMLEEGSAVLGRKTGRALRRQWRKYKTSLKKKTSSLPLPKPESEPTPVVTPTPAPISVSDIPRPAKQELPLPSEPIEEETIVQEEIVETFEEVVILAEEQGIDEKPEEVPQFMKEKLALFYQRKERQPAEPSVVKTETTIAKAEKALALVQSFFGKSLNQTKIFFQKLSLGEKITRLLESISIASKKYWRLFTTLSSEKKHFALIGGGVLLCGAILGFFFLKSGTPAENQASQNQPQVTTPETKNVTTPSNDPTTILGTVSDPIITSVVLNDQAYAISTKSVITVSENKAFAIPDGSTAKFAAAMDDLRLIFVYTESGRLYAFSPISKTFVENTLSLSEGARVAGIGTYLTYLYVLDSQNDQIYRFPRADGGFGAGTPWMKDTVTIEDQAHLAVNETIFLSPNSSTIEGFFRGRKNVTLESPEGGLSVSSLYTYPDLANVYALDREHGKLFVWNQEGKLLNTYANEKISGARSLSVDEKTNEAFIGTENSLLSFKLK